MFFISLYNWLVGHLFFSRVTRYNQVLDHQIHEIPLGSPCGRRSCSIVTGSHLMKRGNQHSGSPAIVASPSLGRFDTHPKRMYHVFEPSKIYVIEFQRFFQGDHEKPLKKLQKKTQRLVPGTPSVLFFGNFTPKTGNYCLKKKALGFPGGACLVFGSNESKWWFFIPQKTNKKEPKTWCSGGCLKPFPIWVVVS